MLHHVSEPTPWNQWMLHKINKYNSKSRWIINKVGVSIVESKSKNFILLMQNYYKADKLFHLRLRPKQFLNRLGRSASIQNIRRDLQARAKHSATTCTKRWGRRSVQSNLRQVTMNNRTSHLLFADIDPSMRI